MNEQKQNREQLPVAHKEDVEFSRELADHEDIEAQARAAEADARQEGR